MTATTEPSGDKAESDATQQKRVNGVKLLDAMLSTFKRYVVFPDDHAAVGTVLWTVATHALPAFQHAPRLVVNSPEKRCGKSRLLDVIGGTCHRPISTIDATVAALFRSLNGDHSPTLVVDEADAIFGKAKVAEQHEDLRALLNAGFQRGRDVLRCVGPQHTPTLFPVFAMAALAGIGRMPDTITDRAVNITLRRRVHGEEVAQFRARRDGPALAGLRKACAKWAAQNVEALTAAEPDMPVEDRAADTWEPLIAIADAAGGRWPEMAREACRVLVARAEQADVEESSSTTLLSDIRNVFAAKRNPTFLPSAVLVTELRKLDESPWGEIELKVRGLANRLKGFGVRPGTSNDKAKNRGYHLADLQDAFDRYLPPGHPVTLSVASAASASVLTCENTRT